MKDTEPVDATRNPKFAIRNSQFPRSRHDQKLEFILRTAARIFAEKSYHSTSMRDISRATNVSLAGLYHYCRSKEELLFLIQDNCFGRVLERLEQQLQEVDAPVVKLRIFIENHLSFFAANMAEMKVLSHEAESLRGDLHAHVSTRKDNYTKLARKILQEVQELTNHRAIDLTVATYALFGMMNWIYNWYDPQGKLGVHDLAQHLTQLFIGGFSPGLLLEPASRTMRIENLSIWNHGLNG
ncbi:MAG TPA: TetR/AcrR family transcriptional regulator [Pyrinomonadaceae bacterium]|jgi:AcrR family transcriptional regulator|nr:TetR/AcrR family transcriptional regulator [Pyrinomonadaceae bacterium]